MIEKRLSNINGLSGRFEILADNTTAEMIEFIRELIWQRDPDVKWKLVERDVSPEKTREWLRNIPISCAIVYLCWPSYREAVEIKFDDFVNYYDDIWYPMADDVYVISEPRTWILKLDHEEVFYFYA